MAYRVVKAVFPEWQALAWPGGWTDTFVLPITVQDGLPPADRAGMLRDLARYLAKRRPDASLWVRLADCPGTWFEQVLRDGLDGLPLPVAVTQANRVIELGDFNPRPWLLPRPPAPPQQIPMSEHPDFIPQEWVVLRVLARLLIASTKEIAALAGRSPNRTLVVLKRLEKKGLIRLMAERQWWRWRILRSGLSLALRSWHSPPIGLNPFYRERRAPAGKRHVSVSRTWLAWLKRAWPGAEVWAGWSELSLPGRMYPDGLAWGRLDGRETLFWLEVESGHHSTRWLQEKMLHASQRAADYAYRYRMHLIFCLLTLPWCCRAAVTIFSQVPGHMAVVVQDWRRFGRLPRWAWGAATMGDGILSYYRIAP